MEEKLTKFLMNQCSVGNINCENMDELIEGILDIFE